MQTDEATAAGVPAYLNSAMGRRAREETPLPAGVPCTALTWPDVIR